MTGERTIGNLVAAGMALLLVLVTGCREAEERMEAVESLPQSTQSQGVEEERPLTERTGRGSDEIETILEFGLFGPVLPTTGAETYEGDCRFEDDPYESCL